MKTSLLITALAGITLAGTSSAGIVVHGSATGYQNQDKDWLTHTTDDIDGNGLGTDGYIFFGDFDGAGGNVNPGNDQNENIFGSNQMGAALLTASQPVYISVAATGADSSNVGSFGGYEQIDNPLIGDGTDGIAANLLTSGAGEALEFTVSGLAAGTTIRVGIVTVLNDDSRGRFAIPSISLTDGVNTASVTALPNLSADTDTTGPGWVFFDIDADGDYVISAPGGAPNPEVGGIGGVTFDSVVPEPGSMALLGLGGLMMIKRRRRA